MRYLVGEEDEEEEEEEEGDGARRANGLCTGDPLDFDNEKKTENKEAMCGGRN